MVKKRKKQMKPKPQKNQANQKKQIKQGMSQRKKMVENNPQKNQEIMGPLGCKVLYKKCNDENIAGVKKKEKTAHKIVELSFKKRVTLLLILFVVIISFAMFGGPKIQKFFSKPITANSTIEVSDFRKVVNNVISDISSEHSKNYVINEHFYNENNFKKYIGIISEVSEEQINKDHVKKLLWNVFIQVKKDDAYELIQKDEETLILECVDKDKMNMLDYALLGVINDDIIVVSKGMYISQNNEKFESIPYGTSNVKQSGCGPVSLTMAINYVNGREVVKLEDVLKWANTNDMYEENAGTRWSLIRNFPNTVSVKCQELYINSEEKLVSSLNDGTVYITSMHKGHFTDKGHFIVINDINSNGIVSVLDPASISRSLKKWDIKTILEESNNYFWKIEKS